MADGITFKFNLPEFSAQLRAFGDDFEKKTVRSATAAAAGVFKKLAMRYAPVLRRFNRNRVQGALRSSIYVARSRSQSGRGTEHYVVSFRKRKGAGKGGDPFYGRFLEAGWIPRGPGKRATGRHMRALQSSRSSGRKISYPFLQPSFAQGKDQALQAFTDRIQKRLDIENAKR